MTHIPGTSEVKTQKKEVEPKIEVSKDESKENKALVLNIKENIKKKDKTDYKDEIWYFQLKYWVVFGTVPSTIFLILTLFNSRFLIITPLGPITAIVSWYIRRLILKNKNKFDAFSK